MTDQVTPESPEDQGPVDPKLDNAAKVYEANKDIIKQVLKSTGPWGFLDGYELAQDFVADQLPKALESFDPEVGPIEPWLFRVFQNFARKRRAKLSIHRQRHAELSELHEPIAQEQPIDAASGDTAVLQAFDAIPEALQDVIRVYYGEGNGSIRAVSDLLDMTRYRAEQRLYQGLNAVVQRLSSELVDSEAKAVCKMYFEERQKWEQIEKTGGLDIETAKQHIREVVELCSPPLTIRFMASSQSENSDDSPK